MSQRKHFGDRIRELRTKQGLSLKQVADAVQIPTSSYADLETTGISRHAFTILPKLSSVFGTTIADLLGKQTPKSVINDCHQIKLLADEIVKTLRE